MTLQPAGAAITAIAVVLLTSATAIGSASDQAAARPCQVEGRVALVIDFGDRVTHECVEQGDARNGAALLGTRARFNASGLVCAIDGVPADGCGEQVGDKYAYWSYWHGTTNGWEYSNIGPAGSRLKPEVVEGWRWNPMGNGNPTDPAPNYSSDPAATCTPPAPPAETTTTVSSSEPSPTGSSTVSDTSSAEAVAAELPGTTVAAQPSSGVSDSSNSSSSRGTAAPAGINAAGDGPGSAAGLVAGVGLVAGIAGAGVLVARRRARP